jgi:hypothetical protein
MDRVTAYRRLDLPGQPMAAHMGTTYLINDLAKAVEQQAREILALTATLSRPETIEVSILRAERDTARSACDNNAMHAEALLIERNAHQIDALMYRELLDQEIKARDDALQLAADRLVDAERYRWLREQADRSDVFVIYGKNGQWGEGGHTEIYGELLDSSIDAARAKASWARLSTRRYQKLFAGPAPTSIRMTRSVLSPPCKCASTGRLRVRRRLNSASLKYVG